MRRGDGSSGGVTLAAASDYGPANAKAAFAFPRGGVDLSDLAVEAGGVTAAGSVSLRRATPSAAESALVCALTTAIPDRIASMSRRSSISWVRSAI